MSFLTRFFRRGSNDDNWKEALELLEEDITKRRNQLNEIRLRERRATLLVTLYTLSFWALYLSIWYLEYLPNFSGHADNSGLEKAIHGIPVVVGPIIILFVRRIVQIWYKSKGDHEEKVLKDLLKRQKEKIDEIKKKTNYEETRNLLDKYETPNSTPRRPANGLPPLTPIGPGFPQHPLRSPATPASALPSAGPRVLSPQNLPLGPPRKGVFDKLADLVLGDDEQGPSPGASRYALICEKCHNHNGLVKESLFEQTQYICPKCGHFNPSILSRKSNSPTPSLDSSPAPPKIILTAPVPPAPRVSSTMPKTQEREVSPSKSDGEKGGDEDMELDSDS